MDFYLTSFFKKTKENKTDPCRGWGNIFIFNYCYLPLCAVIFFCDVFDEAIRGPVEGRRSLAPALALLSCT